MHRFHGSATVHHGTHSREQLKWKGAGRCLQSRSPTERSSAQLQGKLQVQTHTWPKMTSTCSPDLRLRRLISQMAGCPEAFYVFLKAFADQSACRATHIC